MAHNPVRNRKEALLSVYIADRMKNLVGNSSAGSAYWSSAGNDRAERGE